MNIRIGQILKKIKQGSINYAENTKEYVCTTQQIFSLCLFLFFALHIVVISILDFTNTHSLQSAIWLSTLQMLFSLFGYFIFKYYFRTHKKHILMAAYLNIFQVIMILELQYYLYDEYISYAVIICILLVTALTLIGHIKTYMFLILFALCVDIMATIYKNYDVIHYYQMKLYFIDTLFILVIAVGINFCVSWLKYQDFEKQQQIIYLSERDSLTGLLNRNALTYAIQAHTHDNTACALILLDLDNFKALNDTLGHYQGDHCLCAVAKELDAIFEQTGYVCRLGGDEFVIFMNNISNQECVVEKTNMLLERIPRKYPHPSGDIQITCSIGVTFSQTDQNDLYEKLYKEADSAMYVSKAKGKNTVTFFSNINADTEATKH